MSLINEALKKAQRARTGGLADDGTVAPGSGSIAKRGKGRDINTVVLLGSGAVVLVVLSVVVTIYLFQRPDPKPATPPASVPAEKSSAPTQAAPAAVQPVIPPPAATSTPPATTADAATEPTPARPTIPTPTPAPVTAAPSPADRVAPPAPTVVTPAPAIVAVPPPAAPTPPTVATPPAAATPPPSAPVVVAPLPPPPPNERIAAFVESIRISGLRSMGSESRVLINDRVYRVNDTVERTLGVRLVKVEPNALTFVDAHGVQYVKHF